MFTGRRWDEYTGLYYYRMRDYSPDLGRFLQPDQLRYIDTMNIYAYCANNPINSVDPMGLASGLGFQAPNPIDVLADGATEDWGGGQPTEPKDCAIGISLSASSINPFTSGNGDVFGVNPMFGGDISDLYTYSGKGYGLDLGLSSELVLAFGSGYWEGDFASINGSWGPLSGSYFCGGDWEGITFGLCFGAPGIALEKTNYESVGLADSISSAINGFLYDLEQSLLYPEGVWF